MSAEYCYAAHDIVAVFPIAYVLQCCSVNYFVILNLKSFHGIYGAYHEIVRLCHAVALGIFATCEKGF